MMNFERVGVNVSSWIWGRATVNRSTSPTPPWRGIIHFYPASLASRRRSSPGGGPCVFVRQRLDAPPLSGPAAVVWHGRDVLDAKDLQTRGRERPDRRLPAGPWALDEHVHLREAVLLGPAGGGL